MQYILERHPDEFGLVPDDQGFVRIKDFLRAISEEPGWGYVRRSHIQEVCITFRDDTFFLDHDRIKAKHVYASAMRTPEVIPPKLLYHCVRRKAYPVVCEKGIFPMGQHHVFLCTTKALAQRIGFRRDPKPVLLTVHALKASQQGIVFSQQGETIYLVDEVPVGFFAGPLIPKERPKEERKKKDRAEKDRVPKDAGGFALDMERSEAMQRQGVKKKGRKKEIAWKKAARNMRRKK